MRYQYHSRDSLEGSMMDYNENQNYDSIDDQMHQSHISTINREFGKKSTYQKQYAQTNICLRPYFLRIIKHTIVDEKNPFILYAVEIESEFSRYVVLKQFSDFVRLQQELVQMKDHIVELNPRYALTSNQPECLPLEKLIPKLPTSFISYLFKTTPSSDQIERNKKNLSQYSQQLIEILSKTINPENAFYCDPNSESQTQNFTNYHANTITAMTHQEDDELIEAAQVTIDKPNGPRYIYLQRGYSVHILSLPNQMLLEIQKFLNSTEKYQSSQLCRKFQRNQMNPSLWREVQIFNKQHQNLNSKFSVFLNRSTQLRVLALKFCPNISTDALALIAEWANPFYLKELYLDGCDKINDAAMAALVRKRNFNMIKLPEICNIYDFNATEFSRNFSSMIDVDDTTMSTMKEVSQGGAYGLQVISLAECKNINDSGITHLKKLKFLHKIILLGCFNVKDEGIHDIAENLKYLEEIDISGTQITIVSLQDLVTYCLNLKSVNISGCKSLNASDERILQKNHVNVECGDDVFRFYLLPEQYSELPKITSSVLKTRATLSVHKVYRYLIKKLYNERAIEELPEDALADSQVEILCNNVVMNPQLQLKYVRDKFWNNDSQILVLHYRKKELPMLTLQQNHSSSVVGYGSYMHNNQMYGNKSGQGLISQYGGMIGSKSMSELKMIQRGFSTMDYQPKKPPLWVPDHMAIACLDCEREFTFLRRIHHCRNCGKCFCSSCSNFWVPLVEYGYNVPVRVCRECHLQFKLQKYKQQTNKQEYQNMISIIQNLQEDHQNDGRTNQES
eukprot:403339469